LATPRFGVEMRRLGFAMRRSGSAIRRLGVASLHPGFAIRRPGSGRWSAGRGGAVTLAASTWSQARPLEKKKRPASAPARRMACAPDHPLLAQAAWKCQNPPPVSPPMGGASGEPSCALVILRRAGDDPCTYRGGEPAMTEPINLFAPDVRRNPYPIYARLR